MVNVLTMLDGYSVRIYIAGMTYTARSTRTLAVEDERALSILKWIDYPDSDRTLYVRAVTVLGSDLYALAEELSGTPDGMDDEWLTRELLMRAEHELVSRVGGRDNMVSYVNTLLSVK